MRREGWRWIGALCVVGFALTAAVCGQTLEPPPTNQAAPPLPEIYQHWLDEDVHYIIKDEERTQFLMLASDQDRMDFVIAFWAKRNPQPERPENIFKEEHYRRIAYSNEHFAESLPGWETDRGEIYIVLGPPDELMITREAGLQSETWRYHEVLPAREHREFRFVDRCKCGHYELER